MTAKKTTAKRIDESRAKKNKAIERYQLRVGYLEAALEKSRDDFQASQRNLKAAREGIRNLRFVVTLLVAGWGLSVGVLLVVLTR